MNKKKGHIDSDFINHSWKEMTTMLDKEMPIKKKKRRFIWFWMVGLFFLIITGIRVWIILDNEDVDKINKPTKEAIIPIEKIAKNTNLEKPLEKTIKENKSYEPLENKSTYKSPNSTPEINTIKKSNYTNQTEEVALATSSTGEIFSKANGTSKPATSSSPIKKADNLLPIIDPNKQINQQIFIQAKRKQVTNFVKLPLLDFPILRKARLPTIIPYKPSKKNHFQCGIYAGGIIPKSIGYQAGIFASWQFHPKWSIYTGIGYAQRISNTPNNVVNDPSTLNDAESNMGLPNSGQDTQVSPTVSTDMDSTEMVPIKGNIGGTPVESEILILQKISYIELPILVQYQLSPRLSIELGGQIGRHYGTSYQIGANKYQERGFNLAAEAYFNSSNATANNLGTPIAQNWDLALLGGLAYKITPKFQAYSNFHFGLRNNVKYNLLPIATTATSNQDLSKKQKWQQLQVGIRYYFK